MKRYEQLSSFIVLKQYGVFAVRPSTQILGRFGGHDGAKHPKECFSQRHMPKLADQKPELANSQKSSVCRGFSLEVFIHLDACFGSFVPSRSNTHLDTPARKGPQTNRSLWALNRLLPLDFWWMYLSIVGWGNIKQQSWNPLDDGDNKYNQGIEMCWWNSSQLNHDHPQILIERSSWGHVGPLDLLQHCRGGKWIGCPLRPLLPRAKAPRAGSLKSNIKIPVCIRGEDLDPQYPSHKPLGPNLSLYKEVSPVKIWSLQKARVNLGQGAKNRQKVARLSWLSYQSHQLSS